MRPGGRIAVKSSRRKYIAGGDNLATLSRQARQMVMSGVVPEWLPELVLRTTFISIGLIFASLFFRAHAVFDP